MNQDNVKLALITCLVWGSLIITGISVEAVVHDGQVATTIVSTFGWVLGVLVAAVAGILGVSKVAEAHVATNPVAAAAAAAAVASEPASDPAGLTAAAVADVGA